MAIYYVKNGGNDSLSGTSDADAWATLTKVNATTFAPGDYVLFNRGNIWRGTLTVNSSGSTAGQITFSSYGTGAKPIIQPTTQVTSWTQVGATDIWYATYNSVVQSVFINDVYVQPAHWPNTVGDNPAVFEYPSANSADLTHLTDALLHGTSSASLIGTQVNLYSNKWTQDKKVVSAWDDTTHIMTIAAASYIPITSMRYFLTAPSGAGNNFVNRQWMMSENTWFYDDDVNLLYVWKTGGGNPGTAEVSAIWSNGVYISNRSFITVDGISMKYSWSGVYGTSSTTSVYNINVNNCDINYCTGNGVRLVASSGFVCSGNITNNIITYSDEGVYLARSFDTLVQNNSVSYINYYPLLPSYQCYGIASSIGTSTVDGNTVSYCSYSGIAFNVNVNCYITNNNIDHTNSLLEDGGGIYVCDNTDTIISGNVLSDWTGYGLYVDWHCYNVIVENNSVTGGNFGILLHWSNGHIVRNNLLTGPFFYTLTGSGIFVNNATTNGTASIYYNIINCVDNTKDGILVYGSAGSLINVYNNTILNSGTGIKNWSSAANIYDNIENNILYNNTTHIDVSSGDVNLIDYNLYYGTGNWIWGGASQATFALWKTACSGDTNGLNVDPLFISTVNFNLQPGSPCINTGTNVGLIEDYYGSRIIDGVDIGAVEYAVTPWWIDQYVEYIDPATGFKYRDGVRGASYVIDKELVLYGFTTDVGGGEGEDVDWENVETLS